MATRYIEADSVDDAWTKLASLCMQQNRVTSRDGDTAELVGTHVVLDGSREQFLLNPRRKLNAAYAAAEILWYLAGEKKIARLQAYAPQYERFADPATNEAYGAYGYRIRKQYGDLLAQTSEMIRECDYTRQAVIPIYAPQDVLQAAGGTCKDIPCTLTWQFLARWGKLNMVVNMRSNDLWLGFPYDVYAFTTIQKMVAGSLGYDAGEFHLVAGSSHVYERNSVAVTEALNSGVYYIGQEHETRAYRYTVSNLEICDALLAEERARVDHDAMGYMNLKPSIMKDLVLCCVRKHGLLPQLTPDSFSLRKAMTS